VSRNIQRAWSPGYERLLAFPADCRSGPSPNGPDFVLHFQASVVPPARSLSHKPVLALIVLLSSLLWYGLAVVGEGRFAAFFGHPARIALVIIGVVLAGANQMI